MPRDVIQQRIRRRLLKPLETREPSPASKALIASAWARLAQSATAADLLPIAKEVLSRAKKSDGKFDTTNPDVVRGFVDLATVMVHARLISFQEYAFYVSSTVSPIHEDRVFRYVYPEFIEIEARIDAVERSHGLSPDESWHKGEGPAEFQALSAEYGAADERRYVEALYEFGADDLAKLYAEDRIEYTRRRERGRRHVFHRDDSREAITDAVKRYEAEARRSAQVGAYTGAIILLGAAVEGLLLLRCLRSQKKAHAVASSLPKKARPSNDDLLRWNLDNLIEVCLAAGWLPLVDTGSLEIRPDKLAHLLRVMRNGVHVGRVAKERPWIATEREDYEQAEAIYTTVYATTLSPSSLKALSNKSL
jgi:hypothetical protein